MSTQTLPFYRNVVVDGDKISGERLVDVGPKRKMEVIEVTPQGTKTETIEIGGEPFYVQFSGDVKLTHIKLAVEHSELALVETWKLQDGYGVPGFVPAQGWDWSGLRDSSPAAIDAMYEVARKYFSDDDFKAVLGLS